MSQPRTPGITLVANRPRRVLGALFVIFLMVVTSLPGAPVAIASHPTPSEAASTQPQDTSTATPTPTPTEEELKLQQEKAILDLKKGIEADKQAIADSQKAQLDAKYPKPTTSPLAGTTTISDGAVIESQIVSYFSMANSANRIINGIRTHMSSGSQLPKVRIDRLAIYNEKDINLYLSYKVANSQISSLQGQFCRVLASSDIAEACATPAATPACPGSAEVKATPTPENVNAKSLPLAGTIATSFLGAFVDFTALLRTNVDVKGMSFDIDEGPLVAEVFRAARRPQGGLGANVTLYYPYVFPPDLDPSSPSALLKRLEDLHTLRIRAGKLVSDLEKTSEAVEKSKTKIKQLKAEIKKLSQQQFDEETAINNLFRANFCPRLATEQLDVLEKVRKVIRQNACPRMPSAKREDMLELAEDLKQIRADLLDAGDALTEEQANLATLTREFDGLKNKLGAEFKPVGDIADALAQLKAFNSQFDNLVKSLIEVDAASGANPLTNYIKVENLMGALPFCGSYWLQLKILKAGGNNRIKTNLITDIFTGGNRISHSGGVIVQYHLFDAYGRSVASDTITQYTNYIKANKVKDLPRNEVDEAP